MSKKSIHIVPSPKGGWDVKRAGSSDALSHHRTQAAADRAGRPIARREKTELVTHKQNGQIRDSDSFGPDPTPPVDKKH